MKTTQRSIEISAGDIRRLTAAWILAEACLIALVAGAGVWASKGLGLGWLAPAGFAGAAFVASLVAYPLLEVLTRSRGGSVPSFGRFVLFAGLASFLGGALSLAVLLWL